MANQLYSSVDEKRGSGQPLSVHRSRALSLTVAVRLGVLQYYRDAATEKGHAEAGHAAAMASICWRTKAARAGPSVHRSRRLLAPMVTSQSAVSGALTSCTWGTLNGHDLSNLDLFGTPKQTSAPEPASLGTSLLGLAFMRRRKGQS